MPTGSWFDRFVLLVEVVMNDLAGVRLRFMVAFVSLEVVVGWASWMESGHRLVPRVRDRHRGLGMPQRRCPGFF